MLFHICIHNILYYNILASNDGPGAAPHDAERADAPGLRGRSRRGDRRLREHAPPAPSAVGGAVLRAQQRAEEAAGVRGAGEEAGGAGAAETQHGEVLGDNLQQRGLAGGRGLAARRLDIDDGAGGRVRRRARARRPASSSMNP